MLDRRLMMAMVKTDLWVTVSAIAGDPQSWVRYGLDDALSRAAPASLGLLM